MFSNSPLVDYVRISPNKSVNRGRAIDTITIHCVVGQVTVERLGEIFARSSRQASSNYGIGYDGRVGMYVEEKDRSWCSGGTLKANGMTGSQNDYRAVTIEVASDTTHPYAVTEAAYEKLIILVADICKRNGIKKLLWKGDKNLVGNIAEQNMTVHRWFAARACPGDYLYSRHSEIAERVNNILSNGDVVDVNGEWDRKTTYWTQKMLGTPADGEIWGQPRANKKYLPAAQTSSWKFVLFGKGSVMIKSLQTLIGAEPDGKFGPKSVTQLEYFLKAKGLYNGVVEAEQGKRPLMGAGLVKALQKYVDEYFKG